MINSTHKHKATTRSGLSCDL